MKRITLILLALAIATSAFPHGASTVNPRTGTVWGIPVHGPHVKKIRPAKAKVAHIGPMPWQ